jgi:hypothetical protein
MPCSFNARRAKSLPSHEPSTFLDYSRLSFAFVIVLTTTGSATRRREADVIPLPDRAPWASVFQTPGFRISADTLHVEHVDAENAVLVWFITVHDQPRHADSLTFHRSRIRLLVRCKPFAFRSVSQDLTLDGEPPRSHIDWEWTGPRAPVWRVPERGATDDEFLRKTCILLRTPVD